MGTNTVTWSGFLLFPSQELVQDRTAPLGPPWLFYDRAYARWLPTYRDAVSPDGRYYAYTEGDLLRPGSTFKLHVVNVATQADGVIYTGPQPFWPVLFAAEGIYVTANSGEGFEKGLWLMNPAGGAPRLISSTIYRPRVANGAAWGVYFNPADLNPGPGGIDGPYNTLLRYDLQTGAATTWWYQPGAALYVIDGDYSGNLFIAARTYDGGGLWVINSSKVARLIYNQPYDSLDPGPGYLKAVDSNGVWFDDWGNNGYSTLWLYARGSLERVATLSVDGLAIAGGCIPGA